MSAISSPVEAFYSYADANESLCIELERYLSVLLRESPITT